MKSGLKWDTWHHAIRDLFLCRTRVTQAGARPSHLRAWGTWAAHVRRVLQGRSASGGVRISMLLTRGSFVGLRALTARTGRGGVAAWPRDPCARGRLEWEDDAWLGFELTQLTMS